MIPKIITFVCILAIISGAVFAHSEMVDTVVRTSPIVSWGSLAVVLIATLLVLDQLNYRSKKGTLPGPGFVPPLIGKLWDSVHPDFNKYKEMWNYGPLACTSVFQKFIVIASTNELSRKIFNTPGSIIPEVVPSMRDILKPDNFVFLQGEAHVNYRKQLNPLFTRKSLGIYLPVQENYYTKKFTEWVNGGEAPEAFYSKARDVAMTTSLLVFCGRYMSEEVAARVSVSFYDITAALELVNFPFPLPGTKVYNAIQARKLIVKAISECAKSSKERMASGAAPDCLLDNWVLGIQKEKEKFEQDPIGNPPVEFNTEEIALTILTFLFASQDASNASLVWLITLLGDHPDVQEKVREEQRKIRPNKEALTVELLDQMTYSKQVVKEVLRFRPPVLMVPHKTNKPISLDGEYTIPKGTILIPSVWPSVHDPTSWSEPDRFDPDRFGPERQEDAKNSKNWLIFGHGPHICLGKEYAVNSILAFLAVGALECSWTRIRTPESDNIRIMSTIYPQDDAIISFKKL